MKSSEKWIQPLSIMLVILAAVASLAGIVWKGEGEHIPFTTIRGEEVLLQGSGLYKYDSVGMAAQAVAQDAVTLFVAIPLLLYAIYLSRRGSIRGKLLLIGMLGYFLYTYASYAFLAAYNEFFLLYVAAYSLSLFALILSIMSVDVQKMPLYFTGKAPIKSTATFLFLIGTMVGFMWLGRIVPPLMKGGVPYGLESYSTLLIQAFDLGLVVPLAFLSGSLLLKKQPWGYLLTALMLIKGLTLLIAISAMIVAQWMVGVVMSPMEITVFPAFTLVAVFITWRFVQSVKPVKNMREVSA